MEFRGGRLSCRCSRRWFAPVGPTAPEAAPRNGRAVSREWGRCRRRSARSGVGLHPGTVAPFPRNSERSSRRRLRICADSRFHSGQRSLPRAGRGTEAAAQYRRPRRLRKGSGLSGVTPVGVPAHVAGQPERRRVTRSPCQRNAGALVRAPSALAPDRSRRMLPGRVQKHADDRRRHSCTGGGPVQARRFSGKLQPQSGREKAAGGHSFSQGSHVCLLRRVLACSGDGMSHAGTGPAVEPPAASWWSAAAATARSQAGEAAIRGIMTAHGGRTCKAGHVRVRAAGAAGWRFRIMKSDMAEGMHTGGAGSRERALRLRSEPGIAAGRKGAGRRKPFRPLSDAVRMAQASGSGLHRQHRHVPAPAGVTRRWPGAAAGPTPRRCPATAQNQDPVGHPLLAVPGCAGPCLNPWQKAKAPKAPRTALLAPAMKEDRSGWRCRRVPAVEFPNLVRVSRSVFPDPARVAAAIRALAEGCGCPGAAAASGCRFLAPARMAAYRRKAAPTGESFAVAGLWDVAGPQGSSVPVAFPGEMPPPRWSYLGAFVMPELEPFADDSMPCRGIRGSPPADAAGTRKRPQEASLPAGRMQPYDQGTQTLQAKGSP